MNDDLAKYMSKQSKNPSTVRDLRKELTPYNPNWRQEARKEPVAKYAKLNATNTFPNDDRYAR